MVAVSRVPAAAGIGLRLPHLEEAVATRPPVPWFEIHPENFVANPHATELLLQLAEDYPIAVHPVGLSVGSATGLDRDHLARVRRLIDAIDPVVVSGHLAWSTHGREYLNDLLPLPYTEETLRLVSGERPRDLDCAPLPENALMPVSIAFRRSTPVAAIVALRQRLQQIPLSPVQLAMRIGVGSVFFKAGLLKYRSWEFTLLLFRDEYQVPFVDPSLAARLATFNELVFSTLLFLGLATRLATVPFLGMIAVIQTFVYPSAWTEHLVWASILIFLLVRGAGAFSLDALIAKRLGLERL